MGYKSKKSLHQQAFDRFKSMQRFGESKRDAILDGSYKDKIFSYSTYDTYWKHTKYYLSYLKEYHPECTNLKQAREYTSEWLQSRAAQGLSAWTVQTEAKALGKLFGISPEDPDYYSPPARHREDIVRSRVECARDRRFSTTNNDLLIRFCKGIGPRKEGLKKMTGKDLRTKDQIQIEVSRLKEIERSRSLTKEEQTSLRINQDALLFTKSEYFVYLKEKGGRERISPVVGPDVDQIVSRFREVGPDERVWQHIHTAIDAHSYRSDYSNQIYRQYARPTEDIPYDRVHSGTGHRYQSEVYHCHLDERGRGLDKRAMRMASIALGHSRIDVVANSYLRGL